MAKIDCLFCDREFLSQKICENEYWVAIYDGYPVSKGHTLLIPKVHINDFFQMIINNDLYESFKTICVQTKEILDKTFNPQSYNIGINNGVFAGQTINHLHVHIIPRYENDNGLPCGVRNIFPIKADYTK